jgi:hypothetical protein
MDAIAVSRVHKQYVNHLLSFIKTNTAKTATPSYHDTAGYVLIRGWHLLFEESNKKDNAWFG